MDISTGNLHWLPCDRSAIQKTRITGPDTHTLYRTSSIILHLLLNWPQRVLYWVESRKHLQSMTLDGKNRQEVWRGTWTADIHMALDLGSDLVAFSPRSHPRGLAAMPGVLVYTRKTVKSHLMCPHGRPKPLFFLELYTFRWTIFNYKTKTYKT